VTFVSTTSASESCELDPRGFSKPMQTWRTIKKKDGRPQNL
jgi:hypothetical protein